MRKTFFLDRDGVMIKDENYLADPAKVRLCPGCAEAIRRIAGAGYQIIVTSNQSGIARGYFSWEEVKAVERRIEELLDGAGAPKPAAWYYCPHHPRGAIAEYAVECDCRKPKPGLLLQAGREHDVDFENAFMIGDKLSDLKAAFAAGCRSGALVMTGHGGEQKLELLEKPYLTARNILDAAEKLLAAEESASETAKVEKRS